MKKIILFITLLFLTCLSYGIEIPKPNGYVSDYENLFTSEQKQELTNILTDYEKATTIEIAILTVSDYGDDIFDFAQEKITTSVDRSFSQGYLYETLGFNFVSKTKPITTACMARFETLKENFRKMERKNFWKNIDYK